MSFNVAIPTWSAFIRTAKRLSTERYLINVLSRGCSAVRKWLKISLLDALSLPEEGKFCGLFVSYA